MEKLDQTELDEEIIKFESDVNYLVPSETRTEQWILKPINRTIYVTKEMKDALIRQEWREWKKMTNAERCDIPSAYEGKFKKCRGNCSECERTRTNIFHSFEEFEQEVNEGKRKPDEMIELCEEYSSSNYVHEPKYDLAPLRAIIDSLDAIGTKIINVLLTDAEATPGAISKITSIPKTTVQRRVAQIKNLIKDKYGKNK